MGKNLQVKTKKRCRDTATLTVLIGVLTLGASSVIGVLA